MNSDSRLWRLSYDDVFYLACYLQRQVKQVSAHQQKNMHAKWLLHRVIRRSDHIVCIV
jgi:hypothetical protein